MARLPPSGTDTAVEQTDDPSVLFVDSAEAEAVLSTLASDTALSTFQLLNERALTASEVAEELDVSVQTASYHLSNLREADLVAVVDTCYSEKGREMDIYSVTADPKVLVLGTERNEAALRQAFEGMAGAIGVSAAVIALWGALSGFLEGLLEA